jgi:putative PIN family toxin of toxin-antitoxin system
VVRALLDTNVIASGLLGLPREQSIPGEILRRWLLGHFTLILSESILFELEHSVFASSYFQERFSTAQTEHLIVTLREDAIIVEITAQITGVASDPDDDHVLAAATSADVTYLVTGDRELRALDTFRDVQLVTPREFLDLLESTSTERS